MRFRSRRRRSCHLAAGLAVGAVLLPLPIAPTLAGGGNVIVPANQVIDEDYYAFADKVFVEGTIQGDLVAVTQDLVITGVVEGNVLALVGGDANVGGVVEGSIRVVARQLRLDGEVGRDVAGATVFGNVRADVGRDVLMSAVNVELSGTLGRDLRGQFWQLELDGDVGGDVDVTVQDIDVGASTVVGGELAYKSNDEGTISAGASVAGQIIRQRPRIPLQLRAVQRLVSVLSLLAFVTTGLVLFWLMRRSLPRAVAVIQERPARSILVGLAALVAAPLAAVPLAITLVGLPLAALLILAWLFALFLGPIPAVTAASQRVTRGRLGLLGAFVAGAIVWRAALWLIPFVGAVLYFATLAWGVGGWIIGAWQARRGDARADLPSLGAPPRPEPEPPEDWELPLPPVPSTPEAPPATHEESGAPGL